MITFPTNTEEIIDEIRDAIGREVTFWVDRLDVCTASGCGIDPITNTALNSFCAVCSGVGYVITLSGCTVMSHVTWKPDMIMNWHTGGQNFDGDCRIQIKLSDEILSVVNNTDFVQVDGRDLDIREITKRGVPELNRILIDCIEKGK